MTNFCPHCGIAVSENNAKNCVSCGKPFSDRSETTKNDSLKETKEKLFNFAKNVKDLTIKVSEDLKSDETKAKIKDFANQAQSFASEKTKDLKDELNKINEARKETANEAKDFESTSKIEKSKTVALSFWSKLTAKQKGILVCIPLIIAVCFSIFYEKPDNVWTLDEYKVIAIGNISNNRETLMNSELSQELKTGFLMCINRGIKSKFSAKSLTGSDVADRKKYFSDTQLKCSKNPNLYMDVSPPIGLDPNIWYALNN